MTDRARKTIAVAFHTVVALAAALPMLVSSAGLSETIPAVAAALYAANLVTRLVTSEAAQRLLPGWLKGDSK
ncbi:hypothetical protein [Streptomyces malaysiensis]